MEAACWLLPVRLRGALVTRGTGVRRDEPSYGGPLPRLALLQARRNTDLALPWAWHNTGLALPWARHNTGLEFPHAQHSHGPGTPKGWFAFMPGLVYLI